MFAPTTAQVRQLLSGIRLKSTWGPRDYCLILLFAHTGLRVGEMTRLKVDHVAYRGEARNDLLVPSAITKGKKGSRRSRAVPLNDLAKACIEKILAFNAKRGFSVDAEAPFLPWKNHKAIPVREVERTFQVLRERVGLCDLLTPHTLRHYFGTNLLLSGSDLYTVKELLGHASIKSTEVYLHTNEALKAQGVRRLSKGAKSA